MVAYFVHMKKFILIVSFLAAFLDVWVANAQKGVTVAIAANMQFAMKEIKADFEQQTGIAVSLVTESSGKLSAQIMEGAPYDVFVSADMKYPEDLYKKGFAVGGPRPYATGLLVLWTAGAEIKPTADLNVLYSTAVKKIAVANPKTAPYGVAAEEALKYYHAYDRVKDKLVYGESIGQTQQFIATQAADIGFIAKSQVLAGEMKGKGRWVDIDPKAYQHITQGAVILKHGEQTNEEYAQRFYTFLYSATAKTVFKKYGYIVSGGHE
jgi:molybdate transport system substrate-binding protein